MLSIRIEGRVAMDLLLLYCAKGVFFHATSAEINEKIVDLNTAFGYLTHLF